MGEIQGIVERAARAESENTSLKMMVKQRQALQSVDAAVSSHSALPINTPIASLSTVEDKNADVSPYVASNPELNVEPMPESRRYSIEKSKQKLERRSSAGSANESAEISMRSGT